MRSLLLILLLLLMVSVSAESAIEAFAYPTPWSFGEGDLTLHLEIDEESTASLTFVVVNMAGDEVVRLQGVLVPWMTSDEGAYVYEAAWDGRGADGRPVAPGTYICYVEGFHETAFRFIVKR